MSDPGSDSRAFEDAVAEHDRRLSAAGLPIWIGTEPTFTDRRSDDAEWLREARGEAKRARAEEALARLARQVPGSLVLRTVGRQYPEEESPRFSLGLFVRRDGVGIDGRPFDPLQLEAPAEPEEGAARRLRDALTEDLERHGRAPTAITVEGDAMPHRVAWTLDDRTVDPDDERLWRPALEGQPIPLEGLSDPLAEEGILLLALGDSEEGPVIELPAFAEVPDFLAVVDRVARVAVQAGIETLIRRGHPPPVDGSVAFTTFTPDPAVLEINAAPCRDLGELLVEQRRIHGLMKEVGLSPYRLYFNGEGTDSGGGGHLSFGGPSPEESPFFQAPLLLPRLLAYLNRHPSLSYLFAVDSIGGSSQSPRPDEGAREIFEELGVCLDLLHRHGAPSPELLWKSLQPFLTDRFGNTHRTELNVEKLWNPYLPGRGQLGVVELRALRMAPTPEHAVARAALFRSLAAHLARENASVELVDWGLELHDRFALPFHLHRDLRQIFRELEGAGFGLGAPIEAELLKDPHRDVGIAELDGCRLEVRRAVEFWPFVGDPTEEGTTRLVDSSTVRLEIRLRGDFDRRAVSLEGFRVPLREVEDESGPARLLGIRYRSFVPSPGLHPELPARKNLRFVLHGPERAHRITLCDWKPDGKAYEGLPVDLEDARERRLERFQVELCEDPPVPVAPRPAAVSPWTLDARRL